MNIQIYEEASDWIVKNRESILDAQAKKRFDIWLRESPQHIRAYLEMSTIWEDTSSLDPSWNVGAEELIARARADNVFPFGEPAHAGAESNHATNVTPPQTPFRMKLSLAFAASLVIALFGAWVYTQRNVYSTDIGEQRSIVLNDGSIIDLNSRSRIRVRFSDAQRDVDLLDGQALFRVAKNPARPFVVHSDSTRVRAVGTQFDVYKKHAGTVVTVVEGRVAVFPGQDEAKPPTSTSLLRRKEIEKDKNDLPHSLSELEGEGPAPNENPKDSPGFSRSGKGVPGEVLLIAGEQLTVTQMAATAAKRADVTTATAWTQRKLVFHAAALTEVAEEFNRYNTRRLVVIESPQLVDFHVSGMFSSVDSALLLRFLRTQPEISVEETDSEIRISKK